MRWDGICNFYTLQISISYARASNQQARNYQKWCTEHYDRSRIQSRLIIICLKTNQQQIRIQVSASKIIQVFVSQCFVGWNDLIESGLRCLLRKCTPCLNVGCMNGKFTHCRVIIHQYTALLAIISVHSPHDSYTYEMYLKIFSPF